MKADPVRALALISVAVANAPPYERVWIEDIYQNIYCGAAQGIRKQATGLVADWRTRYGRKPDLRDRTGLGILNTQAVRTCENGEPVPFDFGAMTADGTQPAPLPDPRDFAKGRRAPACATSARARRHRPPVRVRSSPVFVRGSGEPNWT